MAEPGTGKKKRPERPFLLTIDGFFPFRARLVARRRTLSLGNIPSSNVTYRNGLIGFPFLPSSLLDHPYRISRPWIGEPIASGRLSVPADPPPFPPFLRDRHFWSVEGVAAVRISSHKPTPKLYHPHPTLHPNLTPRFSFFPFRFN